MKNNVWSHLEPFGVIPGQNATIAKNGECLAQIEVLDLCFSKSSFLGNFFHTDQILYREIVTLIDIEGPGYELLWKPEVKSFILSSYLINNILTDFLVNVFRILCPLNEALIIVNPQLVTFPILVTPFSASGNCHSML